jgi:hypothetical protein
MTFIEKSFRNQYSFKNKKTQKNAKKREKKNTFIKTLGNQIKCFFGLFFKVKKSTQGRILLYEYYKVTPKKGKKG